PSRTTTFTILPSPPRSRRGTELPRGWRHSLLEIVDERPRLRRDVSRRGIDHVDRCGRRTPVAEHALESTCAKVVHALERGYQGDTETADRGRMKDLHVAGQHARR